MPQTMRPMWKRSVRSSWQLFGAFSVHFNRLLVAFEDHHPSRKAHTEWVEHRHGAESMVWLGCFGISPSTPYSLILINLSSRGLHPVYFWAPGWQMGVEVLGAVDFGVESGFGRYRM